MQQNLRIFWSRTSRDSIHSQLTYSMRDLASGETISTRACREPQSVPSARAHPGSGPGKDFPGGASQSAARAEAHRAQQGRRARRARTQRHLDLEVALRGRGELAPFAPREPILARAEAELERGLAGRDAFPEPLEIGRASCRERVES